MRNALSTQTCECDRQLNISLTAARLGHVCRSTTDPDSPTAQTSADAAAEGASSATKAENDVTALASSSVEDKSKIALSEVERAGYQYGARMNAED